MNKPIFPIALLAGALCLISGGARADDTSRPLTREEVVAQVMAARQSGELAAIETGGSWSAAQPTPAVSRDQVVADVLAARQTGELAAIETGSGWNRGSGAQPMSREQVIAEFMKTRHVSDASVTEHSI